MLLKCGIFFTWSLHWNVCRVTAYVPRFVNNSRNIRKDRVVGSVIASEIKHAILRLTKIVQSYSFFIEIKVLHNQQAIPRNSKLLGLAPFIDYDGIIRVGGRLASSNLSYSTKHSIVLSSKHIFTKILIEYEHERLLHAGPQITLASLRQHFWLISGRSAVRHVTCVCIKWFKAAPKSNQIIMANLPTPRVSQSRPFGIDYAGLFMVLKNAMLRVSRLILQYLYV